FQSPSTPRSETFLAAAAPAFCDCGHGESLATSIEHPSTPQLEDESCQQCPNQRDRTWLRSRCGRGRVRQISIAVIRDHKRAGAELVTRIRVGHWYACEVTSEGERAACMAVQKRYSCRVNRDIHERVVRGRVH